MEIGNQQGRLLYVDFDSLMLHGISVTDEIRKDFNTSDNLKFILNINESYQYFSNEFGLTRDQVKRTKKKIFDIYQTKVPDHFREVVGFTNYLVNEYGVVVNKRTRAILKSALTRKGYPCLCLTNKCTKTIHRIVARAWIPNPKSKPEVNHIDGNKLNNFVSNLEWNTQEENANHKRINNLGKTRQAQVSSTGQNNSQAKLLPKHIFEIRSSNEKSLLLSEIYGVTQHTINDIRARRSWNHV